MASPSEAGSRSTSWRAVVLYLVGMAGLAMSLTLLWFGMRAVMDVGGACADGGPYVSAQSCPEGAPPATLIGILGLFAFGGLAFWNGSSLRGPYTGLVFLAWPALFVSLGWNFLEYGFNPPGPPTDGEGWVWGWIFCGVVFVLMGAGPLLLALPWLRGSADTPKRLRVSVNTLSSRAGRKPVSASDMAELATALGALRDARSIMLTGSASSPTSSSGSLPIAVTPDGGPARTAEGEAGPAAGRPGADVVDRLERLAALHDDGALTDDEYERAKAAVLGVHADDTRPGGGA